jgi:succinate dehydrogenase/fumarate reductase flavoprotein subunit
LCRVMQDYCGEFKSEGTLRTGLQWIRSIRESEAPTAFARNPHELCRVLECHTHMTVGEIIMQASLARKASSALLDFKRLDYPKVDPPEWHKIITLRLENWSIKAGELPLNYYLLPPYASSHAENYSKHCGL